MMKHQADFCETGAGMKRAAALMAPSLLLCQNALAGSDCVSPLVADAFGKVSRVQAVFVDKTRSYYDRNCNTMPYLIKVLSVDSRELPAPIVMEYFSEAGGFQKGKTYTLKAFETIFPLGDPKEWNPETQVDYQIRHRLIVGPDGTAP